jgi:hypothetical protein
MADLKLPLLSNIATSSLEASFALVKTIIFPACWFYIVTVVHNGTTTPFLIYVLLLVAYVCF